MLILHRRSLAFLIDYLIMLVYIALLLGATLSLVHFLNYTPSSLQPLKGQLIGFFTLTLPVFFYFFLSESGTKKGSLGKQKMGIQVNGDAVNLLVRNVLKFLPWEVAHTGVHWMVFYQLQEIEPPTWVWVLLILPQVVAFTYFISLLISGGKGILYDQLAGTSVSLNS